MNAAAGSDELLTFIKFLRSSDLPISPADTLDAVHVASLLGYEDRASLKQGLAAVLAKSLREQTLFDTAFETFFSQPDPLRQGNDATSDSMHPMDEPSPADNPTGDSANGGGQSALEELAASDANIASLLGKPLGSHTGKW